MMNVVVDMIRTGMTLMEDMTRAGTTRMDMDRVGHIAPFGVVSMDAPPMLRVSIRKTGSRCAPVYG